MGSVPGDSNVQSRLKTSCIKDILCSLEGTLGQHLRPPGFQASLSLWGQGGFPSAGALFVRL